MEEKLLNDQEIARREKLAKYAELGVDPYGQRYEVTHHAKEIRELCKDKTAEEIEALNLHVSVAGRIKFLRKMGKASFFNVLDKTGPIQVYIGIDVVGEKNYELFKLADVGDIVGITGYIRRTPRGELSIAAESFDIISFLIISFFSSKKS